MFFSEKVTSIRPQDRVLEVGPGASPHPRSNAFLELTFDTAEAKILQRGGVVNESRFGIRPVYFYDGNEFPFKTDEFDYVICSHVIEHVPDPSYFMSELFRVGGGRGYLEYPLITYEYLYNFQVHLHFVKFDDINRVLRFLPKVETSFDEFSDVTRLFYKTLENGWDDLCAANKDLFFEGFEFHHPFLVERTAAVKFVLPSANLIQPKSGLRKFICGALNRLDI